MFFEHGLPALSLFSPDVLPKDIQTTNISDTSFSLTWTTAAPATGAISVQPASRAVASPLVDDRDSGKKQKKYKTHTVSVHDAEPLSEYKVTIISNGHGHAIPASIKTGPTLWGTTNIKPVFGTLTTSQGNPASEALLYLTAEGGQTLSTLVGFSGSWLVPLNLVRTTQLSSYIKPDRKLKLSLRAILDDQEVTAVTDTSIDSPLPLMQLGKTYDFRTQAVTQALPTNIPPLEGRLATNKKPTVSLTAPVDGSALPTLVPFIGGTGIPGKILSLVIGITNPISAKTTVDPDGTWHYSPPKPLSVGKNSVTVSTIDENGKPVAITHVFTLLKSGTQVLGESTPSATLTPTPTTIATISATPTIALNPTATPTPLILAPPPPVSGVQLPTIILSLVGGLFMLGGLTLFVF